MALPVKFKDFLYRSKNGIPNGYHYRPDELLLYTREGKIARVMYCGCFTCLRKQGLEMVLEEGKTLTLVIRSSDRRAPAPDTQ